MFLSSGFTALHNDPAVLRTFAGGKNYHETDLFPLYHLFQQYITQDYT